jgi:hypothetical protein
MNLLRCLLKPNKSPTNSDLRLAKELLNRLFTVDSTSDQEIEPEKEAPSTLEEELNEIINGVYDEPQVCHEYNSLKTEFNAFAKTGCRTGNLQKLYDALLTIKPTSTDVERVFSTTNWFCSKIRSRLSDKSLSALVFLKLYYESHG